MTMLARALAALALTAGLALAPTAPAEAAPPNCDRPAGPAMPAGEVVTRSQIEGAHRELTDYLEKVRAYFACLEQENKNVAAEAQQAVAGYERAKAAYERLIR